MLSFFTEEDSESSNADRSNDFRESSPTLQLMESESDVISNDEAGPSNSGLRRSPRKFQSGVRHISAKKKARPGSADVDFELGNVEAVNAVRRSPRRSARKTSSRSTPVPGSSLLEIPQVSGKADTSMRKTGDGGSAFREMSTKHQTNTKYRWREPRKRMKNVMDELLSRELQAKFSKDGLKGKRRFAGTMMYKCIKEALSADDGSSVKTAGIDYLIGDLLKRAIVNDQS